MGPELTAAPPPVVADQSAATLLRELEERRALTDAVFAASYDGIAILDPNGVYLEVNPAYERMTGIPMGQENSEDPSFARLRLPGRAR